jgi:hypothetical protein
MERGTSTTNSATATAAAPAPAPATAAAAAPSSATAATAQELGEMYKDHEFVRDVREPHFQDQNFARNFLTKTGLKNLNVCKGN